jgi:hypothetical protein
MTGYEAEEVVGKTPRILQDLNQIERAGKNQQSS